MKKQDYTTRLNTVLMSLRRSAMRESLNHHHAMSPAIMLLFKLIIDHYAENTAPITVSNLAEKMDISLSALSQSLDILEKKGMIERVKSPDDKRVTNVLLTRRGQTVSRHHHHHANHHQFFNDLFDYLGDDDSAELVRLMEKIADFTKNRNQGEKDLNAKTR
ncbi:MarR family transcriptional regulator [Candidatus Saccharibacteria bacterium]|nr:MarR family transcriptional regulator [Candidatus Saccharibacteria bacterium]